MSQDAVCVTHESTSTADRSILRKTETTPRAVPKTCQELFQLVPERVDARASVAMVLLESVASRRKRSDRRQAAMPLSGLLIGVREGKDARFAQTRAADLQSDRQPRP